MVNKIISPLISPLLASVSRNVQDGVGAVRSLTWREIRDMLRFAGRRLREESLPQVAGGLTFTTVFALVPVLTIALAIFTTFPMFNTFRTALEAYFIKSVMPKAISSTRTGVSPAQERRWRAFAAIHTSSPARQVRV